MPETLSVPATTHSTETAKPRVGFLGVGWIGRSRMEALAKSGLIQIAAIADPDAQRVEKARELAPQANALTSVDDLLKEELDGVVIATPSALHAEHSIAALQAGCAVFCQKPLARTVTETRSVVEAAFRSDRLLGVDLSYRYTKGMQKIRELVQGGELGEIFAVDLVFHNAYGPDQGWYYDPQLAGGGCVMDLGIHLVDLAMWVLDAPLVHRVESRLFTGGKRIREAAAHVEDYAVARVDLESGAVANLVCSWKISAGVDCVIEAAFYGTKGGAALRNINGSFYDFKAELFRGTQRTTLAEPPEDWGAGAAVDWAKRLSLRPQYDDEIEEIITVAEVLDAIYGRKPAQP